MHRDAGEDGPIVQQYTTVIEPHARELQDTLQSTLKQKGLAPIYLDNLQMRRILGPTCGGFTALQTICMNTLLV